MAQNIIYTDGACSKNGSPDATGGFGLYIHKSCFGNNIKINRKGESMRLMLHGIDEVFNITNIRMEGLAIISTMVLFSEKFVFGKDITDPVKHLNDCFLKQNIQFKLNYSDNELDQKINTDCRTFEIVTDSQFWINVIQSWLPAWVRKGILTQKKNVDLLLILYYFSTLFEQNKVKVLFTHVRSHQKGKRSHHADGNDEADVLATSSAKNKDTMFHQI
jgi:ribonuclease HI